MMTPLPVDIGLTLVDSRILYSGFPPTLRNRKYVSPVVSFLYHMG